MEFVKRVIKHAHETEIRVFPSVNYNSSVDRQRKYRELDSSNLDASIQESIRRTKETIKDYARNNDFDYFVTLTLDPHQFNSFEIDTVYHCANLFIRRLKLMNKNQKTELSYLFVPEYHQDKQKIHLHGFIKGSIAKTYAINEKTGELVTYRKKPVYNLPQWSYGYSSAVKIGKTSTDTLRCANYISKYVTKDLLVSFNKKRYWCSKGLKTGKVLQDNRIYENNIKEAILKSAYDLQDQEPNYRINNFYSNDFYGVVSIQDN